MNQAGSPKEAFRAARIFFAALTGGSSLFLLMSLVVYQVNKPSFPEWPQYRTTVLVIVLAFSFIVLLIAKRNFNRKVISAKDSLIPLKDKLTNYTQALISYCALCEFPILLSIVLFIVIGDFAFLAYAAVLLGFLLSSAPTKKRVVETLQLNSQEERELE